MSRKPNEPNEPPPHQPSGGGSIVHGLYAGGLLGRQHAPGPATNGAYFAHGGAANFVAAQTVPHRKNAGAAATHAALAFAAGAGVSHPPGGYPSAPPPTGTSSRKHRGPRGGAGGGGPRVRYNAMVRTASGNQAPTSSEGPGKRDEHRSSFGPSSTAGPAHREAATGSLMAAYYEGQDYYNGRPFKGKGVQLNVTYDSNLAEIRAATRSNPKLSGKINPATMDVYLHTPVGIARMEKGISIRDTITGLGGDFESVLGKCDLRLTPPRSAAAASKFTFAVGNDPFTRLLSTLPKNKGAGRGASAAAGGAGGGGGGGKPLTANLSTLPTGHPNNVELRKERKKRTMRRMRRMRPTKNQTYRRNPNQH